MITDKGVSTINVGLSTPRVVRPKSLSVVIPALNEEDAIADIVQRVDSVRQALDAIGISELEIIVVDDGSVDRTVEIAMGFPYVRLVRHPENWGYGAAIKSGFLQAHGDLLCFLDADGTYPPEMLPKLCQVAVDDEVDIVVGSRRSGAATEMPFLRRLGNYIWSNLVSLMGNRRVVDPASGMRILHRAVLSTLYPLPDGLNFTPVMSTRAVHEGLNVIEVPIPYRERVGRSKLSIVHDGTRFLTTILWTALEYNPSRVLGIAGMVALAATGLILAGLVALRLQGVTTLGHFGVFAVFNALVLGVSGVSIFALGVTFNYLVSLFHRRPVQQGLFGRPIIASTMDRHFGWLGTLACAAGSVLAMASLVLGLQGWEITRLWLWLLGSALLVLIGLQLVISWMVMRVLEALSEREMRVEMELKKQAVVNATGQ